jgi:hypothetical protein
VTRATKTTSRPCACPCCGNRATSAGLLVLGVALAVPSPLLAAAVCTACQQLAIKTATGRRLLAQRLNGG